MMDISVVKRLIAELWALPSAKVQMSGDEQAKVLYRHLSKPHPRYKIVGNKCLGVGLIPLPDGFDEYLKGKDKQALRTNRNRCLSLGYTFRVVNPIDYLKDIMDVNSSMDSRQGREMRPDYLDEDSVQAFFATRAELYAILSEDGILKAYADAPLCGDVCVLNRLLGHGEEIENGVIYLLISEIIREMIERKVRTGAPKWAMYDTFFGASSGLRYFKERLGFKPYKVKWRWSDD